MMFWQFFSCILGILQGWDMKLEQDVEVEPYTNVAPDIGKKEMSVL